jgi:DNA-binding MarR family transcriptional regulator
MTRRTSPYAARTTAIANGLHSAAIHLLRRLRREDDASGMSGPRGSALSVIVYGGPVTLGALATAEQVRPPTMTRLIADMVRDGLVERVPDATDGRVVRVRATARGTRLLEHGRTRRLAALTADLEQLPARDLALLARAVAVMERVVGSGPAPRR